MRLILWTKLSKLVFSMIYCFLHRYLLLTFCAWYHLFRSHFKQLLLLIGDSYHKIEQKWIIWHVILNIQYHKSHLMYCGRQKEEHQSHVCGAAGRMRGSNMAVAFDQSQRAFTNRNPHAIKCPLSYWLLFVARY